MVRYKLPLNQYVPIAETSGVIQNLSTAGSIRIARSENPGNGFIVLPPLHKMLFAGKIYASSMTQGFNSVLVVYPGDPVGSGDGGSGSGGNAGFATNAEVSEMLTEVFGE